MGMLQKIAMENKTGRQIGVFSVCTSNQLVIRAALRHAGKRGYPLVLEATSNQCNQFGGYTGMTPKDYMDMVHHLVEEEGCPASQLILGGDHLGPLVSCHKPEREAMKDAADMIRAYAAAGFGKIHIDTSMRLGDDAARRSWRLWCGRPAAHCLMRNSRCWWSAARYRSPAAAWCMRTV